MITALEGLLDCWFIWVLVLILIVMTSVVAYHDHRYFRKGD